MTNVRTVLFLCTGNYYRSRLAEHYFNALADRHGLGWRAVSRGLQIHSFNIGPMAQDTLEWLAQRGIAVPEPLRHPLAVTEDDFQVAEIVVAVKEAEHRSLLDELFPARTDSVEFWHVHDLDFASPEEALPVLAANVEALVLRLSG
jgi:protein-tyrosine phosphatase